MYRFHAVPAWALADAKRVAGPDDVLRPAIAESVLLPRVLEHVEYRGEKATERAARLAGADGGKPAVYAQSPNDLPALLRTANQLITLAREEAGERAQHRRCSCGARYTVPVLPVRPITLKCTRCGNTVDLDPPPATGAATAPGPATSVHDARIALAAFFREAMARGWPVLVSRG